MASVANGKPADARRRQRTGTGEVVPRRWEQWQARMAFFRALLALVPDACSELWRSELVALYRDREAQPFDPDDDFFRPLDAYGAAIAAWQDRHNLPDFWCHMAADHTVRLAAGSPDDWKRWGMEKWEPHRGKSIAPGGPDADLYEGKVGDVTDLDDWRKLTYTPERLQRTRSVWLDDLKLPDVEFDDEASVGFSVWQDEGDFGTFDPRAESLDDAVKRLMPKLEARLRQALLRMVGEDTAGDTVRVRALPPDRYFGRLVRYQVLGESIGHIAKTTGVDRRAIARGINETASLCGLTLRAPTPAGRPGKRARCVKVTSPAK